MSGLRKVLQSTHDEKLRGGGAISQGALTRLNAYRKQQMIIFVVVEILVVMAVAFCAYMMVMSKLDSAGVASLTALIGIGAGGGLEVGRRVWKEWAQADLLVLLLSEATEAQVNSIIDKLLQKL